jgi:IclR family transcriptional regulator, pca regulon regulatory protein
MRTPASDSTEIGDSAVPSAPNGLADDGRSRDFVQSLERGLAVITSFSRDHPSQTLSEVAAATGVSRATARRFLHTLLELGYVGRNGSRFFLRPRVLRLGYAYLSSQSIWEHAQDHIRKLADEVHDFCGAGILDETEVVYVLRVSPRRFMTTNIAVGTRLPAYCTSIGRVLLAELPPEALDAYFKSARFPRLTERTIVDPKQLRATLREVKQQGWALDDQEWELGVRSIAAPVFDVNGTAAGAISVVVLTSRCSLDTLLDEFLPKLRHAADAVSAA